MANYAENLLLTSDEHVKIVGFGSVKPIRQEHQRVFLCVASKKCVFAWRKKNNEALQRDMSGYAETPNDLHNNASVADSSKRTSEKAHDAMTEITMRIEEEFRCALISSFH